MYGIPNMKLEKHIIDRKIEVMKAEGVTFITGADVGKNYKAGKLKKEFDSIILACGASNPRDLAVCGREAEGIFFAVDFFAAVFFSAGFSSAGSPSAPGSVSVFFL